MAAWREEQRLEHIAQESYPELPLVRKCYPQFFHKTDRWGRPVWIELLGSIDVDHMLQVRRPTGWQQQQQRQQRHRSALCDSRQQQPGPVTVRTTSTSRTVMVQWLLRPPGNITHTSSPSSSPPQVISIDRFLRHHIQSCESFRTVKLPACSAAAGRPILTQVCMACCWATHVLVYLTVAAAPAAAAQQQQQQSSPAAGSHLSPLFWFFNPLLLCCCPQTIILDMQGLSPMKHFTLTVQRFLHTLSTIDQVRGALHQTLPSHEPPSSCCSQAWCHVKGPTTQSTDTTSTTRLQATCDTGSQAGCPLTLLLLLSGDCCFLQDNFPEHLGCLFMINTPLLFRSFW